MLNDLSISNFAIIDEMKISFNDGLTVISGETGAGKSIIIGAVSLLLGDRASSDMIRTQTDTAEVEALFDIGSNKILKKKISDMGWEEGNELVIRRVISRSGKNKVLINGRMATLANLAAIGESLINICGQHEHQVILDAENHIDILDEFGDCLSLRAVYEESYDRYQEILSRRERLEKLRRNREEKTDLIRFQLKEIEDVDPRAEEDKTLSEEKKVLINTRKLADCADEAYGLLYGESGCAVEKIKEAQNRIKEIKKIDGNLQLPEADIENGFFVLQEAALILRDYGKKLFFDEERLAAIDERLEVIGRLKRKHGGTLADVFARKQMMEKELLEVSRVEEELNEIVGEELAVRGKLAEQARNLSQRRRQAAEKLQISVNREIHALYMPHASFSVNFIKSAAGENFGSFNRKGGDELEFYLTANAGEDPKPLNRIASGGELSRIVLALKNVLAHTGSVGTVVFDEVDSGIGGATAEIVGRKLKDISASHQVICITHLPQIACYGDNHLRVVKKINSGRTTTSVFPLEGEQKVEEISRMLGGVDLTSTTRDHAREMLAAARLSITDNGEDKKNAQKSTHR